MKMAKQKRKHAGNKRKSWLARPLKRRSSSASRWMTRKRRLMIRKSKMRP